MGLAMRTGPQERRVAGDRRRPVLLSDTKNKWLQVVSHLDPKYGGLSAVVPELTRALGRNSRYSLKVAAFCIKGEECKPDKLSDPVLSFWPASRGAWLHNPELKDRFKTLVDASDGLHLHGLWEQSTAVASRMARAADKPYMLSAHGMLEPWALRQKRWKKIFYAALIERQTIKDAACLHALTRAEAGDYRRFGARGPIVIVPNGVHISEVRDASLFLNRFPKLDGQRLLLFLGRLHAKKGVDLLVRAWAQICARWPEAHLVLAGPDTAGTQSGLEQIVRDAGIEERVTFTGMLQESMKWSALAASEVFVLPSHSEGLSVSVLEAMGMGLPVIVTAQCHMPEVLKDDCGWQIQPSAREIASALEEALQNSPAENLEIGCRGRCLVEERYDWTSIAARMADVYRWVQGGPKPNNVELVLE